MFHTAWYGHEPVHQIQRVNVPWLWIGAVYPNETIDATNQVDNVVQSGDIVNADYLASVTGHNPINWKYLDAKTLEENDFPSNGIVI